MAWIELHQTVWTHRKTLVLAATLGIEPDLAATRMLRLWTWSLDNCPDGDLSALPPAVLAFGTNWNGDGQTLIDAMVTAGYLDRDGDRLVMHDWLDYAGRLIERRREDAARKRRSREGTPPGAGPGPSTGRPPDVPRNRTQPYSTAPYPTVPSKDEAAAPSSVPAPRDELVPVQRATLEAVSNILPDVGGEEHQRLLLALVRDYPAVDLPFEATRCCSHFGTGPRRWAGTFADWVTRAQSVRYWDGGHGPPAQHTGDGDDLSTAAAALPLQPSGISAWDDARRELRAAITPSGYEEWFAPLSPLSLRDDILTLRAGSPYHRDWLRTRLDATLRGALASAGHPNIVPNYVCDECTETGTSPARGVPGADDDEACAC